MENKKKKIVVGIPVFVLTAVITTQLLSKKDIGNELVKMSEEINKNCPVMVDEATRLDSVSIVDSKSVRYNYSVITINKDSLTVDLKEVKAFLKNNSQNNLDTIKQMELYREKKIPLNYHYNDKNGKYLLDFTIVYQKDK